MPAKTLHTRYLICLWHIYATLEAALDVLSAHPALAPIYNPAALSRAAKLEDDIRYFLDLFDDSEDWKAHPEAQVDNWPKDTQDALKAYISRLQSLAAGQPLATNVLAQGQWDYAYPPPQPSQDLLLSHAYVRYMGDMSGGQEIRKSIAAAYSLPLDANDGQRFYEFGERGFDVREIKGMKRQFRTGLDKAGFEVSEQVYSASLSHLSSCATWLLETNMHAFLAEDILQEANHTFELNIRLFSSFATSLPSDLSPAHSHSHQHPHHGQHASAAAGSGAKKGQCPFKHLQFAGQNTSRATQQGLRRLVSMSGSFQSALAALLVLALALLAYQLFASSA